LNTIVVVLVSSSLALLAVTIALVREVRFGNALQRLRIWLLAAWRQERTRI
jgi:hypothetical protein